ncbi:MAG TPA: P1 family peptidase [Thermodesulfobacteriota bacterium]|nr:P1 family peptidase [Thermodesulfobacteriota bacterium]
MYNALTDVAGFQVGHAQDLKAATGCTVILCPPRTLGGLDVRGSAAGTRQTDSLHPFHYVDEVHAVCLSGGSAFGLDASGGVMRFLEESDIGYPTSAGRVPIVPTAIIYDLGIGEGRVRPTPQMGYEACLNAASGPVAEGSVGAGTGATVGKLMGVRWATKGGVGTSSITLPSGVTAAALVVVNAFGDVLSPTDRSVMAGARDPEKGNVFVNSAERIKHGAPLRAESRFQNTTLGVVATNVKLSKRQAIKVAQMAQAGLARTISPIHSTVDGDLIFALSCGDLVYDLNAVGLIAEEAVAAAVIRAVQQADGLGFLPAWKDLNPP